MPCVIACCCSGDHATVFEGEFANEFVGAAGLDVDVCGLCRPLSGCFVLVVVEEGSAGWIVGVGEMWLSPRWGGAGQGLACAVMASLLPGGWPLSARRSRRVRVCLPPLPSWLSAAFPASSSPAGTLGLGLGCAFALGLGLCVCACLRVCVRVFVCV